MSGGISSIITRSDRLNGLLETALPPMVRYEYDPRCLLRIAGVVSNHSSQ